MTPNYLVLSIMDIEAMLAAITLEKSLRSSDQLCVLIQDQTTGISWSVKAVE